MRIGIDATSIGVAGAVRSGVHQYVLQLLRQLARIAPEHEFRLFFGLRRAGHAGAIASAVRELGAPHWTVARSRVPVRWIRKLRLPVELWCGDVDVFHAPAHLGLSTRSGASAVTVCDLAFLRDRAERPPPRALDSAGRRGWSLRQRFFAELREQIEHSVRTADGILAISEHTASSLVRELGVDRERICVTHLAAREEVRPVRDPGRIAEVRERHGLPEHYGLCVGTLDPNRNIAHLLRAFARYRESGGSGALALAGARGWYGPLLEQLARQLGIAGAVRFLGHVSDADLCALLSGARWNALPSTLEGFGIPALEAMACGTPPIAARAGALPEVVGDAALLVDPGSEDALAEAMRRLDGDAALREALVSAGAARARSFSWERTARETLAAYARIAERGPVGTATRERRDSDAA